MNGIEEFFNDDPWEHINSPTYPNGQRLYQKDERFWVSMDAFGIRFEGIFKF